MERGRRRKKEGTSSCCFTAYILWNVVGAERKNFFLLFYSLHSVERGRRRKKERTSSCCFTAYILWNMVGAERKKELLLVVLRPLHQDVTSGRTEKLCWPKVNSGVERIEPRRSPSAQLLKFKAIKKEERG